MRIGPGPFVVVPDGVGVRAQFVVVLDGVGVGVYTGLGLFVIIFDGTGVVAGLAWLIVVLFFIWHCWRSCWGQPCLLLVALGLHVDVLFI